MLRIIAELLKTLLSIVLSMLVSVISFHSDKYALFQAFAKSRWLCFYCFPFKNSEALRFIFTAKTEGAYDHRIVNDDVDVAYEKFRGILCAVSLLFLFRVMCS